MSSTLSPGCVMSHRASAHSHSHMHNLPWAAAFLQGSSLPEGTGCYSTFVMQCASNAVPSAGGGPMFSRGPALYPIVTSYNSKTGLKSLSSHVSYTTLCDHHTCECSFLWLSDTPFRCFLYRPAMVIILKRK